MKTLADVTTKIGSGATPRGGNQVYQDEGTAFIRSQNVQDLAIDDVDMVRISDEAAYALRGVAVRRGDVLVNITGESVARVAVWDRDDLARVSQHVAIVRPAPGVLDSRFLAYWLHAPAQKGDLEVLSAAGASRRALTKGMLSEFRAPEQDLTAQQAIAEVLGALDDKIAANRRVQRSIDDLLDASFRKASRSTAERVELGSLIALNYGKSLPSSKRVEGPFPVVGSGGVVGYHDESLVDGPAVIVGRKGSVGSTYWISEGCFPIDTTYWVAPNGVSLGYAYRLLQDIDFVAMNTDSAVPGLNRERAYALQVPLPDGAHLEEFDRLSGALTSKHSALQVETSALARTRDDCYPCS